MSAEVFIDTNVFIHRLDATDARKQAVADSIVREALVGGKACISFQVIQEWLNTVLHEAAVPLSPEAARSYLDTALAPLLQVPASLGLYQRALDVQGRWRFGFYDSLIVAAALSAGCWQLLSEDLQHGQRIETLTVHNPFIG